MDNIKKITSFTVDHRYIAPGIYVSRIDGDVTTYDMRTRRPNCGDYMDNATMHSFEHKTTLHIYKQIEIILFFS
jgi:S-ribosylhomocysteine lyase